MWSSNAFTERLKLKWPILQAPMGWLSTPALAAAVSNAGGLGGLGMWGFSAEDAERRIAGFRQQSGGSLNVNYPLWPKPDITREATDAMRARLQPHYDAKGLGRAAEAQDAASAVQMGTAFLRCEEGNVKDAHRAALREASDAATIVTDMLTGRPARYIRNALADDLIASGIPPVAFPAQMSVTAPLQDTGDREMTLLFAGQSAALGRDTNDGALWRRWPRRRGGGWGWVGVGP